jgi:hypothetical protein
MKTIWNNLKSENNNVIVLSLVDNLTKYLSTNNVKEVFCFDNSLLGVIDFLSGLKVISWGFNCVEDGFWPHPYYMFRDFPIGNKVTVESVYEYQLKNLNPFYLIRNKMDRFSESGFQRLSKLIHGDKKQLIFMKAFTDKGGRCFELYCIKEAK